MLPFRSKFRGADASPGFLFWKAANLHQRLQRVALAEFHVTPTQFSLLACFFFLESRLGRGASQAEVCEHAVLDKMVVSDGTRALLKKKLIAKTPSKIDGRAFSVSVTRKGVETCNRALGAVEALDTKFFGRSGDVPAFLETMSKLLGHGEIC